MTWYLRKSVSIGPVRFNLSKSGIGTSVGVKGFRVGVRPDGKSYVHAGRYGLYYRQELGNINTNIPETNNEFTKNTFSEITTYNSTTSTELTSATKNDLITQLNKSYKAFRFDFLIGIISSLLILIFWNETLTIRIIIISLAACRT